MKINKMKLLVIYFLGIVFSISFKKNYLSHNYINYRLAIYDNLILSLIFGIFLFIFSTIFNNINIIDLSWPSLGILFIIDIYIDQVKLNSIVLSHLSKSNDKYRENFVLISIVLILIFTYSIRHINLYLKSSNTVEKEDFRYQAFRLKFSNKFLFLLFSLLCLHLIPVLILTLCYNPINEYLLNIGNFQGSWLLIIFLFVFTILIILFETVADEQLNIFRYKRDKLNIICNENKKYALYWINIINVGLWKYIRHPNYLGEVLYFFSLPLFYFALTYKIELTNFIGSLIFIILINFNSIPTMENKLIDKYKEEYLLYQKDVKYKLIPYVL